MPHSKYFPEIPFDILNVAFSFRVLVLSFISYKLLYSTVLISTFIIEKRCGLWVREGGGGVVVWVGHGHPKALPRYALVISVFYLIFLLLLFLLWCGMFLLSGSGLGIACFRKSFASSTTVQYACNETQKLMVWLIYPKVYQCILQTRTVPL